MMKEQVFGPSRDDGGRSSYVSLGRTVSAVRNCDIPRQAPARSSAGLNSGREPSETDDTGERRANPIGRAVTASVPRVTVGGLRLAVLDLEQTADFMIEQVSPKRRASRPL